MLHSRSFLSKFRIPIVTAIAGLAIGAPVVVRFFGEGKSSKNPQFATPALALASLTAKSLYFNAVALPWLLSQRPDLLTDEEKSPKSDQARSFAQAALNPKLFRQLDRRYRFDTLLLVGDPSQYRPLLEHILEAKDWTLTYLDHSSIVYRRESEHEWKPVDLKAIEGRFEAPHDHSLFLAQAAGKLLAIRRGAEAKELLDQAQSLDAKVPEVWNGMAIFRMLRGEWNPAITSVDKALALDRDFLPAIATKTQILFSTKKFSAAYDLSEKLIAAYPDDPGLLFYHAKICHEAHAYTAEIRVLKKLIERADAEAQPATGYRLYLAQAYAAAGHAQPAADEFKRVLADPELAPEQRRFAEQTLAQIEQRAGLK